jgi:hypothetical protein
MTFMTPRACIFAALTVLFLDTFQPAARAFPGDSRIACSIYKAKTQQWKTDNMRSIKETGVLNNAREYENTLEIKKAMMTVLIHLGYTQQQVAEMRAWDMDGHKSRAFFWKDGIRIARESSPYRMEVERGLMGKEPQTVAFCEGLGIQIRAR